ncbi:MAG: DUF192 domain-containing protein [Flavobacteriaceae bacterium]|nr:DUF192 domain-containing protein [Bacteroidia bacterium]MBT8286804.1 DUF192 domain-containing protein [Bacteroidia bacterium]NNF74243.1 DUF192 domain-containing protein [Flavobacteriaceae bacterium]NNK71910.1 DUF192 domain-containing protein [Flavobacteriaceae bacterium]
MRLFNQYLLFALIIILTSCKETSNKVVQPIKIEFKNEGDLRVVAGTSDSLRASFKIEVADDDYEHQRGLMDRQSMENDQAMLFIFPDSNLRSFYMKSTYIPLDIIYIGQDRKIVSIRPNNKPLDETSIPSGLPAMYVLEVNAGLAEQYGMKTGDSIAFKINE